MRLDTNKIEDFRKEAGLSCYDLAHLLGMPRRMLFRVRHGRRKLTRVEEQRLRDVMAGRVPGWQLVRLPDRARKYPKSMQQKDIRAILEQVGSVRELAKLTNTKVFSVMRWLNGNAAPSGKHLKKLRRLKRQGKNLKKLLKRKRADKRLKKLQQLKATIASLRAR